MGSAVLTSSVPRSERGHVQRPWRKGCPKLTAFSYFFFLRSRRAPFSSVPLLIVVVDGGSSIFTLCSALRFVACYLFLSVADAVLDVMCLTAFYTHADVFTPAGEFSFCP